MNTLQEIKNILHERRPNRRLSSELRRGTLYRLQEKTVRLVDFLDRKKVEVKCHGERFTCKANELQRATKWEVALYLGWIEAPLAETRTAE